MSEEKKEEKKKSNLKKWIIVSAVAVPLILVIGLFLCVRFQKDAVPVDAQGMILKDGIHQGKSFKFPGEMLIKMTVKENRITDIEITEHKAPEKYTEMLDPLIQEVILKQSTGVDSVSGATISSRSLKKAINNAIQKASQEKEPKRTKKNNR
ncbi:FMN-binding protein [Planctomycetota bacterium]